MCLAVPGQVVSIETGTKPLMGRVSFGGVLKEICFEWLPEVSIGEYVIVHVGFAIARLDKHEAEGTIALLNEAVAQANHPDS